jgi:hypothetical protein
MTSRQCTQHHQNAASSALALVLEVPLSCTNVQQRRRSCSCTQIIPSRTWGMQYSMPRTHAMRNLCNQQKRSQLLQVFKLKQMLQQLSLWLCAVGCSSCSLFIVAACKESNVPHAQLQDRSSFQHVLQSAAGLVG